jgi:hypothetical protein
MANSKKNQEWIERTRKGQRRHGKWEDAGEMHCAQQTRWLSYAGSLLDIAWCCLVLQQSLASLVRLMEAKDRRDRPVPALCHHAML